MPAVLFVLMIAAGVVSAYFSYVGGVMGKPETRMLHPLGLGMMAVSLVSALILSLQFSIWTSQWFLPQVWTFLGLCIIAGTPALCYTGGRDEKKRDEKTKASY